MTVGQALSLLRNSIHRVGWLEARVIRQIGFEHFKMSKRDRSFMGFVVILAINVIVLLGTEYGSPQMTGTPPNAELLAWLVIGSPSSIGIVVMCLPFFVCMITGEILAGENTEGTIRALLARLVSRTNVFGAKLVASAIYTAALVGFLVVSAYALGAAFLGTGGLLPFGVAGKVAWYSHGETLVRLALAYGLVFVVAFTIGAIALFISVLVNNSLSAMGGTIMLLFITWIICEVPELSHIKPYLFSGQVNIGQKAFYEPLPWREIGASLP